MMKIFFNLIPLYAHPLLWYTVAFIIGIACQTQSAVQPLLISGLFMASLIAIAIIIKMGTTILITCLLISVAFLSGNLRYYYAMHAYQKAQTLCTGKPLCCTAVVTSIEQSSHKYFKHIAVLKLCNISDKGQVIPISSYTLKLYLAQKPECQVGATIAIPELYIKPHHELYLIKEHVLARLFMPKLTYKVIENDTYRLWLSNLRQRIYDALGKKMNIATYTLFCSIFLGTKAPHATSFAWIKEQFSYWGIVHYLARSGLHVVFIAFILTFLLRFVYCSFILKQIFAVALIVIYYALTGSSISFIRALITFMFYKLYTIKAIPIHPVHALTLICLMVLAYNPLHLFFLDFQLSFSLTFALAIVSELRLRIMRATNQRNY
jgi:ComEC/Rec2-related protein